MGILEFLSREAGQRRRRALEEAAARAGRYIPPNLRPLSGFLADMTPTASLERAGQSSQRMLSPNRTPSQRVGDLGAMLSDTAAVAAPALVAGRAAMPAAQAMQEALLGVSVPARAAGEAGGGILVEIAAPALPNPRNKAEAMAKRVLEMRAAGKAGDVTDDMMALADDQYMYYNTPIPMDDASRMARAAGRTRGYHGTMPSHKSSSSGSSTQYPENPDILAFDIDRSTRGQSGKGIYFAPQDNIELANKFAGGRSMSEDELKLLDPNSPKIKGVVYPVMARADNQASRDQMRQAQYAYDAKERAAGRSTGYIGLSNAVFDTLEPQGFSGVSQDIEFTIFHPENVRSRFARFDPEFRHLRNLSAGVGGVGLLGASQYQQSQRERGLLQ